MEPTQPNEHGVFVEAEILHILTHKSLKTQLEIRVACGPDGKFRSGYSYHFGFESSHSGGRGGPSITGKAFDTFAAAVMCEVDLFRVRIQRYIDNDLVSIKGAGEKVLAAINEFAKTYEAKTQPSKLMADAYPMRGIGRLELTPPADPQPDPAPALKPRSLKPAYVLGWKYGGNEYQQYLQRREKDTPDSDVDAGYDKYSWWPTRAADKGSRFKTVDAALAYFRKIFWYHPPEGNVETFIYGGHLQIFESGPAGLRQIPRLTRQKSLFDNLPALVIVEKQPDLIKIPAAADCFTRDETKILRAGFVLVRYDRDKKTIQRTWDDSRRGWAPAIPFNTYAVAEKTLKEMLKIDTMIEVSLDGKANMTTSSKKLYAAHFDFYRSEGIIPGHGYPRIKQGRKNWATWEKYESAIECQVGWDMLMSGEMALQG